MPSYLEDREVSQCNCQKYKTKGVARFWKFKTLDEFIINCNFSETHYGRYRWKVLRKNPFSLQEIAAQIYISGNKNNIKSVDIPITLKEELKKYTFETHQHYKIAVNEKRAEHYFAMFGWENFVFGTTPTGIMKIAHRIWIQKETQASRHQLQGLTLDDDKE